MGLDEEQDGWDDVSRTKWKGLGTTDPIKALDVRLCEPLYLSTDISPG